MGEMDDFPTPNQGREAMGLKPLLVPPLEVFPAKPPFIGINVKLWRLYVRFEVRWFR